MISPALPLKILMVIPGNAHDHFSMIFARRQVEAIAQTGCRVQKFYLASRTAPVVLLRELRRFQQVLKNFQPDLVHAHYGTMTAFFCMVGTLKPLVITFRGSDLNPAPSENWLRHQFSHLLSQAATLRTARIICVSQQLRSRLWRPLARRYAEVIPMPVNLDVFHPMPRNLARQQLGWSMSEPVVLFNGGSHRQVKRLDLAEAAVRAAQAQWPQIKLTTLSGNADPQQIPLYLNAADVLLMTSDFEGSPNIVKEGLACNLPVVSVEVGDVAERLKDVHPSKIVERNPQILGRALVEVLQQNCRSNGRDIAQRDFAETVITKRVLAVYQEALQHTQCRLKFPGLF
ncbi:MAG: glycosyltransferase [Pseudomonadota bacterium]